jgi:Arc/MetJ-type ribon-helix-helix transcriptional regulator
MTITLTPAQQAWLEAQVAAGRLPSIEDGVQAAITDMMSIRDDDLAWAAPYVDQARASAARGEVVDGQAFLASLEDRIARLRAK